MLPGVYIADPWCCYATLPTMWTPPSPTPPPVGDCLPPRPQTYSQTRLWSVGRSIRLLLAFASTVIPFFSHLVVHDKDLCSLLDMYMFRNGTSSSTRAGPVFLCRRYVCCTSELTCYEPALIAGRSVGFVPVSTRSQRNMRSMYVYIFAVV
jgi:hypothetical protein